MTAFRFTKKGLSALEPTAKRTRHYDSETKGLVLDVAPSGRKTFRVYKKIKGRRAPVTVTLGQFPAMTVEQARNQALEQLNTLSGGVNPNEAARAQRVAKVALAEVFEDYLATKRLRAPTIKGYRQCLRYLEDWQKKPLIEIGDDQIKRRHQAITQDSPAQADYVMRLLRALYNFAAYEYRGLQGERLFPHNPVKILSHQSLWNHVPRRHSRIERHALPDWYAGLTAVRAEGEPFTVAVCDLLEMALLTGLRRSELLDLTWERVNLAARTYWISATKNGNRLELPLPDHLASLLQRRRAARPEAAYVFYADNRHGVVREPKKVMQRVTDATGIAFTMHDLRRTFTTTAEALNVGTYTLKRLLNHRTRRDDVTAGYTVLTPEELRSPAQRVENELLTLVGVKEVQAGLDHQLAAVIKDLSDDEKRQLLFELSDRMARTDRTGSVAG